MFLLWGAIVLKVSIRDCANNYTKVTIWRKKLENQLLTFKLENEELKEIECNIEIEDDSHWNKVHVTCYDASILKIENKKDVNVSVSTPNISGVISKETTMFSCYIRNLGVSWGNIIIIRFTLLPKKTVISYWDHQQKLNRNTLIRYYINKAPMYAPYNQTHLDR
ncbi:hypothetical protein [Erwinia sp. 198]|uniref:hypothetical protein n=1 Tax=Erwinia sp. 198 TaxID=2022746 RepID=UPI000F6768D7|nr:hypothetical protein [Erwinia sp. 198]RRZ88537.1 hypothetical protein EGK14_17700 [Erwinia sp. 198]